VGAGSAALADDHEQPGGAPVGKPSTYRPLDDARPVVKGLRLPRGLTARLRDFARLEGTTVHGALCAAFVIAGRQVSAGWRDSALRILSPINIRLLLEVGESCGVFVNAATSTFDGQTIGFWELARDAKAAIAPSRVCPMAKCMRIFKSSAALAMSPFAAFAASVRTATSRLRYPVGNQN
jgi:hypothetical protein